MADYLRRCLPLRGEGNPKIIVLCFALLVGSTIVQGCRLNLFPPPLSKPTEVALAVTPAATTVPPQVATATPSLVATPSLTIMPILTPTRTPILVPFPTPTAVLLTTPRPASGGELAFVRDGDIWVSASDGTQARRLTFDGGCSSPQWSPDGRYIVFVRGSGANSEIYLIGADGRDEKRLTHNNVVDSQPVWSPRGSWIAYTRRADNTGDGKIDERDAAEIWLTATDGGGQRKIADGLDPAWSPEGLRLAFATNGELEPGGGYRQNNSVHLINTQGKNEWELVGVKDIPADLSKYNFPFTPGTISLRYPAWSSDGKIIAFMALGHTGLIGIITDKAKDLTILDFNYEGGFGRPSWSPKGRGLAYESLPASGINHVIIRDLTTGTKTDIGDERSGLSVASPSWAPDGKRLALVRIKGVGQTRQMYLSVVDVDGSNLRRMVEGKDPHWNPVSVVPR
ncbi:MAG: hypothetical protein M1136_04690 [Chloroflexi bacterium]|nr:hypothetical protein [Chloroflexota bacterium]MCL5074938.1 hypothetical protein [Chloroflexota bacterium]